MKAYIITSETDLAQQCIQSIEKTESALIPEMFPATTPGQIKEHMRKIFDIRVKWNYPLDPSGDKLDMATGLYKKHYPAANPDKVIACAVSHLRLWKLASESESPFVVLEHDAIFQKRFDFSDIKEYNNEIVGLNDPRGVTRKSAEYYQKIMMTPLSERVELLKVPALEDDLPLPCGLAGNSAYIISPEGGRHMLDLVESYGLWPNDAIMCRQLLGSKLKVTYPFFTKCIEHKSTTTT